MKTLKILGLALLITGLFALPSLAQNNSVRTVTNTDLEKYRQARVKADEDYRQNYKRLGRPSPEELEQWEAERQKRLSDYSLQLQTQRRQEEYFELFRAAAAANNEPQIFYLPGRTEIYQSGYAPFVFRGFRGGRSRFGSGTGFGPNVQMVRDQASMFPSATRLINRNSGRRGVFRGGFGRAVPGRVFSPRR